MRLTETEKRACANERRVRIHGFKDGLKRAQNFASTWFENQAEAVDAICRNRFLWEDFVDDLHESDKTAAAAASASPWEAIKLVAV